MYFRKLRRKKDKEIAMTRPRHGNTGTYYMIFFLSEFSHRGAVVVPTIMWEQYRERGKIKGKFISYHS